MTSSALTALRLAKPALLDNQCESRIKGLATKPFANAIATLIPAGAIKDKLVAAANSDVANDEVWNQIGQLPPPISSVPNQIHCGCLISDSGLSLTDISEVTNAVAETSQQCGKMLDSAGLGFINKIGGYVSKLGESVASDVSGKYDEIIGGQSDPDSPGQVYEDYYGDRLGQMADYIAKFPSDWLSKTYYNNGGQDCAFNTNAGQWEGGGCHPTLAMITDWCVQYYDDHKMSKSNATKVCTSFQDTLTSTAAIKAKQIVAKAAVPKLIDGRLIGWIQNDWQWRLPPNRTLGYFDFGSDPVNHGSAGQSSVASDAGDLYNHWVDVMGHSYRSAQASNGFKGEMSTGIYAGAENVVFALGNDPEKAVNLAYAATLDPLRDKSRSIWQSYRKSYDLYQLREWYPTPQFSYIYDCPGDLVKACAAAVEAKFDKLCYTPLSELYIAGPKHNLALGGAFEAQYSQKASACKALLAPVIAAAKKLTAAKAGTIAGLCKYDDRNEMADCNQQLIEIYESCANDELKVGKDEATECFNINYELFAHPGASNKSPTNPADIPEKKKKSAPSERSTSAPIIGNVKSAAPPETPILVPIKPIQKIPAPAAAKSTLCQFTSGPRAGQVQDYAPMAPIPVGSNCKDARGSFGIVVAH